MMNTEEQRAPRTTEAEIHVSELARREADRQARRIRWERLLEARQQYVAWNAFSLWARAIAEAEGEIPAWLAKVLEERCPGFLGVECGRHQAGAEEEPLLWRRLLEWIESNALRDAKDEGWLRAVTFYAVRDPVYARDCAYWQQCERVWKQQRPSSYPSFEEWRRASEQCDDEVLDAFEMTEGKRQIIKASRAVRPDRLAKTVAEYMEWEAFTYWLRSLLEAGLDLREIVSGELERRCPGFLQCDQELRSTLSPQDYTRRWKALLKWGENRFFAEAKRQGWFDAFVFHARAHPRSVRTVDYWVFYWDEHRSTLPNGAYPSFQEWRRAADNYVQAPGAERPLADAPD